MTFFFFFFTTLFFFQLYDYKHRSAYSRTEPENTKTGCQDLSPVQLTYICVYIILEYINLNIN